MMIRERRKHRRLLSPEDVAWLTSSPHPAQEARRMRIEVAFAKLQPGSVTWEEFRRLIETEPNYRKLVQPRLHTVEWIG